MSIKYISKSYEDTLSFAKGFAGKIFEERDLSNGNIFLLIGELGAGKTAFVRGFATYWKLDGEVLSPTFTIVNEYNNEELKISHIDLYRISSEDEIMDLGLADIISESNFSFIEWPEKASRFLSRIRCDVVKIKTGRFENERIIEIEGGF